MTVMHRLQSTPWDFNGHLSLNTLICLCIYLRHRLTYPSLYLFIFRSALRSRDNERNTDRSSMTVMHRLQSIPWNFIGHPSLNTLICLFIYFCHRSACSSVYLSIFAIVQLAHLFIYLFLPSFSLLICLFIYFCHRSACSSVYLSIFATA